MGAIVTTHCRNCGAENGVGITGALCPKCAFDYSQSGEQAAILEEIDFLGIEKGRFLDIGAGDGVTFSNTRWLAEHGWAGVVVEPAAWAFAKLADLYRDRDDVQPVQAIVTPDRCGLTNWLYAKDDLLSTVVEEEAAKWSTVPFMRLTGSCCTLHQLLDWFEGSFSVVSIDAEGLAGDLVRAYIQHPAWASVQLIVYEHERNPLELRGAFEHAVTTTNNVIYRRIA